MSIWSHFQSSDTYNRIIVLRYHKLILIPKICHRHPTLCIFQVICVDLMGYVLLGNSRLVLYIVFCSHGCSCYLSKTVFLVFLVSLPQIRESFPNTPWGIICDFLNFFLILNFKFKFLNFKFLSRVILKLWVILKKN